MSFSWHSILACSNASFVPFQTLLFFFFLEIFGHYKSKQILLFKPKLFRIFGKMLTEEMDIKNERANSMPTASEAIRQHNLQIIQRQNEKNGHSIPITVSFIGIDECRHSTHSTVFPSSRVHPTLNCATIPQNANWLSTSLSSPCPSSTSTTDSEGQLRKGTTAHRKEESKKAFFVQCCFPFLLAGCGMLAAGILLDKASTWLFLTNVPEALILVPALLGLKGNLEMTLASRLSTMVNLGQMDSPKQQLTALYSNVSLVQAQAIIVSLIASLLAVGTHLIEGNQFDFPRSFCVILSSMLTASVASFALASIMVLLAIASHRCGLNPDNIATPIAAALGDVISLAFLIIFGTLLYRVRQSALPILIPLFIGLLASTIFWIFLAARVRLTRDVLKFGWFSVLAAMCISSAGGYVLRKAILHFPGIGLFQPLINGVGGNLVAVQASKISTYLHKSGKLGQFPANQLIKYLNPIRTFSCKERESQNALILLAMSFPGHILFISLLFLTGQMAIQSLNIQFLFIYICAAILQVAILLYLCQFISRLLWFFNFDPDNNSIPLLTAMGDLFGTSLLAFAFFLHVQMFPEFAKLDEIGGTTPAFLQALLRIEAGQGMEQKLELNGTTTTIETIIK